MLFTVGFKQTNKKKYETTNTSRKKKGTKQSYLI